MVRPDVEACPSCGTHKNLLERRIRKHEDDLGNVLSVSAFYSCRCGAFTQTLQGVFNLRNEVAEEYGILRIDPLRKAVAVPPVVRRRA